jgi:cytochrome c2
MKRRFTEYMLAFLAWVSGWKGEVSGCSAASKRCIIAATAALAATLVSACDPAPRNLATPLAVAEACALDGAALRGSAWAPTCRGCHDIAPYHPATPSGGPNLHDIYESPVGTVSLRFGHRYAAPIEAARRAGVMWSADNLDQYLKSPRAFLEGVAGEHFAPNAYIMSFYVGGDGAAQERARQDIIAYLKAIKGRPCS